MPEYRRNGHKVKTVGLLFLRGKTVNIVQCSVTTSNDKSAMTKPRFAGVTELEDTFYTVNGAKLVVFPVPSPEGEG